MSVDLLIRDLVRLSLKTHSTAISSPCPRKSGGIRSGRQAGCPTGRPDAPFDSSLGSPPSPQGRENKKTKVPEKTKVPGTGKDKGARNRPGKDKGARNRKC